jgi:hypothetical protein
MRELLNIPVKKVVEEYLPRIDLDADYQREQIWSTKQQEDLIDSIARDIDIPKIYLVKTRDNRQFTFECLDGKQRLMTIQKYYDPEPTQSQVFLKLLEKRYGYEELKRQHPSIAKRIDSFSLSLCIYEPLDDETVREIFRRLQLGVRLNSGELLKTRSGTIRDFIYKVVGNNGPFFRFTNLSEKRFSRPFTLAQICVNSFSRSDDGIFIRTRLQDIEDFFERHKDLSKKDPRLLKIRKTLELMDRAFGEKASMISSRAVAVSAFLMCEEILMIEKNQLKLFVSFFIRLLDVIKENMDLIVKYHKPTNKYVLDNFQKYILQASVEAYSISKRHEYLQHAFEYYRSPKTKGKILGVNSK